jgi:hypothetical protein
MEHLIEVYNLLHRVRRPGLLPVAERGIGNHDLFGGIGKDEFVVEFHPTNLFVRKNIAIKVWLLNIQERELLYGALALKRSLLSADGHSFSSFYPLTLPLSPVGRGRGEGT